MAVRRIAKAQKDSMSFIGLLKDMEENYRLLTRERFVSLYRTEMKDCAERDFDRISGTEGSPHISPDMIGADCAELEAITQTIEAYADKYVAHHDQRKLHDLPNWNDLEHCIAVVEKLALKYQFLFRAIADETLLPTIIDDWREVFYIPWLNQGNQ